MARFPRFYFRLAAVTYGIVLAAMLFTVLLTRFIGGEAVAWDWAGVERNADWQPVIGLSPGGIEVVLVPAGCFMMGSEDGLINEQPVHRQCFDEPFWISRYEVTNAQFGTSGNFSGDERPRDSVTWFKARDFCASRGARLPTEAEWEYAARGPDALIYSWGDEFVADNVVCRGNSGDETADVGSRAGGVSWVGAYDMLGNVSEWMSTIYDPDRFPYPYDASDGREDMADTESMRNIRGGSWYLYCFYTDLVRTASRIGYPPTIPNGFRCARSS